VRNRICRLYLAVSLAATVVAAPAVIASPDAESASSGETLEAVIVTARKTSEDALKVPVSVTAFSQQTVQLLGIENIADLSKFTPGLTDQQAATGGARSDRSFQSLVLRGMYPSSTSTPTTSIFINGTPVSGQDMLTTLSDMDHVEVLKGPQSAYFGRETFAGAVNVVTAIPQNDWHANLNVGLGTRNNKDIYGSFGGPIIDDKLMFTAGLNYVSHDGSYANAEAPGTTLGDQATKSAHLGVLVKPFENFSMRFYGLWMEDRDGPSATGLLLAGGPAGQGNCVAGGIPFFCGTLPALKYPVSQNTTITPVMTAFLHGSVVGGIIEPSLLVKGFGLKRIADHDDLTFQYDIPSVGLTLTYLVSYSDDQFSEMSDLANIDGAAGGQYPGYPGFPYVVEGTSNLVSHEFRVSTNPEKAYRATVGLSYVDQVANSALGPPFNAFASGGGTESVTKGIFFGLAYDVLPRVTLTFDGRYQIDQERSFSAPHVLGAEGESKDFLPRATVEFKITPDVMTYFTYSKGVNPGVFNSVFATLPAQSIAEVKADGFSAQTAVNPEYLTNYELGLKGRFLDNRATVSAAIYYDQWTNQLNAEKFTFALNDPNNPINVVGSKEYSATQKSPYPFAFTDNTAATSPKGVEFESTVIPIDHVTFNVAAAYNSTKYTKFNCTSCSPLASFNAAGKYLPFAPLFSATAGLQYGSKIDALGASADWFVRADYVYRDGVYIQAANTVKTPNINLVNLRAGITRGRFGIDAYVKNLTNNKSYTTGFQSYDFTTFSPNSVMVGLPELITGGVDLKYKF